MLQPAGAHTFFATHNALNQANSEQLGAHQQSLYLLQEDS